MEPQGIAILVLVCIIIVMFAWVVYIDGQRLKYKQMSKISETEFYFIRHMRNAYQSLSMADYYLDEIKKIAKEEKFGNQDEATV